MLRKRRARLASCGLISAPVAVKLPLTTQPPDLGKKDPCFRGWESEPCWIRTNDPLLKSQSDDEGETLE